MTDLAAVKADTTIEEILKMVDLAEKWKFAGVYALPSHNNLIRSRLSGSSSIFIGGAVGFPSGGNTTDTKVYETRNLIEAGCREIDMVVNITWLKAGHFRDFKDDIKSVVEAADKHTVKAIIECSYLTDDEIRSASELAAEAGAAFIKTSTGWTQNGATEHIIKIISSALKGSSCGIKAAGGIKSLEIASGMAELGVTRFGCSIASAESIMLG